MILYIGLDDTDNNYSRGTGHLAREIASKLSAFGSVFCVTRHQLLVDERIPYTSHNSCAAISMDVSQTIDIQGLFEYVRSLMLADFQPGSDPGLCIAKHTEAIELIEFGRSVQTKLVTREDALQQAVRSSFYLEGLGGTNDGVIGSLAAVGLASCGYDGRYLWVGKIRELFGLQPIRSLFEQGICAVMTLDNKPVTDGYVLADKLRPARRNFLPIQYVTWAGDWWEPVKLN